MFDRIKDIIQSNPEINLSLGNRIYESTTRGYDEEIRERSYAVITFGFGDQEYEDMGGDVGVGIEFDIELYYPVSQRGEALSITKELRRIVANSDDLRVTGVEDAIYLSESRYMLYTINGRGYECQKKCC